LSATRAVAEMGRTTLAGGARGRIDSDQSRRAGPAAEHDAAHTACSLMRLGTDPLRPADGPASGRVSRPVGIRPGR
jgi:hypothetical protein